MSVVVATHNHGPLLYRSVGSALAQTVKDLEVIIVGDGADDETCDVANALALDTRVTFLSFDKEPQSGARNRHLGVEHARGEIICYLDDDDLWAPHHVQCVRALLENADAAHTLPLAVNPDGTLTYWEVDLRLDYFRGLLVEGRVGISKTFMAHTAELYRRLPHGWTSLPGHVVVVDLWRQIIQAPGCRLATCRRPTALQFPQSWRFGWSMQRRIVELDEWLPRLSDPNWCLPIVELLAGSVLDLRTHLQEVSEWLKGGERYSRSLERALREQEDRAQAGEQYAASLRETLERRSSEMREAQAYIHSLCSELNVHRQLLAEGERYARSLERLVASRDGSLMDAERYARSLEREIERRAGA